MKMRLLVHTCSNEHVASAALRSIGGEFPARVALEADRCGKSVGAYVAQTLGDFERDADLIVWGQAERCSRNADQPLLAALYFVLDHALRRHERRAAA
jgi:hypothetical protein